MGTFTAYDTNTASSRHNTSGTNQWTEDGGYATYYEHVSGQPTLHQAIGFRFDVSKDVVSADITDVDFNFYIIQFGNWAPDMEIIVEADGTGDTTGWANSGSDRPYQRFDTAEAHGTYPATPVSYTTTFPANGWVNDIALTVADVQDAIDNNASHATTGTVIGVIMKHTGASGGITQIQVEDSGDATNKAYLEITTATVIDVDIDMGDWNGAGFTHTPIGGSVGTGYASVTRGTQSGAVASDASTQYEESYHDGYGTDYANGRVMKRVEAMMPVPAGGWDDCVLYIPGGGYAEITSQWSALRKQTVQEQKGYISIEYTITDANSTTNTGTNHAEPVADILCALGHINNHADYDLSTGYVMLGHSAGGHLIAEAMLFAGDQQTYDWNYTANGERRVQDGGTSFSYDEGSAARLGVPMPKGFGIMNGPIDMDLCVPNAFGNALDIPFTNYLGGDDNAALSWSYNGASNTAHNGELNVFDMALGRNEEDDGLSMWQNDVRFDNASGEIVGDNRHFFNRPVVYVQGYDDVVVIANSGKPALDDVYDALGVSTSQASLPSYTGYVEVNSAMNTEGGLSHIYVRPVSAAGGHDIVVTSSRHLPDWNTWVDNLDTYQSSQTPAPMAAATVGDVSVQITSGTNINVTPVPASTTVYAPSIAQTTPSQTIEATAVPASTSVENPTVTPGAVSIEAEAVGSLLSVHNPTMSVGSVNINTTLTGPFTAVSAPSIAVGGVTIAAEAVNSSTTVEPPSIAVGGVSINAEPVASSTTVETPSVVVGGVSINATEVAPTTTVEAPSIAVGGVTISAEAVASGTTVHNPTIAEGADPSQDINATAVAPTTTVENPSITVGAVTINATQVAADTTVHNPSLVEGSAPQDINATDVESATTVPAPSIETGAVEIQPLSVVAPSLK